MWPETKPDKFIIWGLLHYTHTHSYIHYAFHKAAKHMGWDVEWVSDTEENGLLYSKCDGFLFLTVNVADKYIPINNNAFYMLHNNSGIQFKDIPYNHKLGIQVFTNSVFTSNMIPVKGQPFQYYRDGENHIYMTWATDLLPHEIDDNIHLVKEDRLPNSTNQWATFLGSATKCDTFGNSDELDRFSKGMTQLGSELKIYGATKIKQDESITIVQSSYMAPSLVGKWQKQVGYIPCRIFKTISYGHIGVTNSKETFDIIKGLGVYNSDEEQLAIEADKFIKSNDVKRIRIEAMRYIRDHHTYINRINTLQYVFQRIIPRN